MPWEKFDGTIEHGPPRWWSCFRCAFVTDRDPGSRCLVCGSTAIVATGATTIRDATGKVLLTHEPDGPPTVVSPMSHRVRPGEN